jgi:hypothetical protein
MRNLHDYDLSLIKRLRDRPKQVPPAQHREDLTHIARVHADEARTSRSAKLLCISRPSRPMSWAIASAAAALLIASLIGATVFLNGASDSPTIARSEPIEEFDLSPSQKVYLAQVDARIFDLQRRSFRRYKHDVRSSGPSRRVTY